MENNQIVKEYMFLRIKEVVNIQGVDKIHLDVSIYVNELKGGVLQAVHVGKLFQEVFEPNNVGRTLNALPTKEEYISLTKFQYEKLYDLYDTDLNSFLLFNIVLKGGKISDN